MDNYLKSDDGWALFEKRSDGTMVVSYATPAANLFKERMTTSTADRARELLKTQGFSAYPTRKAHRANINHQFIWNFGNKRRGK